MDEHSIVGSWVSVAGNHRKSRNPREFSLMSSWTVQAKARQISPKNNSGKRVPFQNVAMTCISRARIGAQ
jgi:hypothetical protein